MKRALIISAHPDDDILGCGGIMSKFKGKAVIKVLFVGEGSSCRFDSPDLPEAQKEIKIRNSYAVDALTFLGINKFTFNNFPCGRFDTVPLIEMNKIIENEIKKFNPDTIFTHSDCDSNKDHVKVNEATIIATRPGSGVENLFSYEVLSSTEWGFKKSFSPNVFFSLSKKNVEDKCNALKIYETEVKPYPYPRSREGVTILSKLRGMQSGTLFSEAFKLIRQFNK